MKFNKKNKKAFSLIETVIYLAIFTIISIVVINSFIIVLSSFSTIRTNHELLNSGSLAMEKMAREIRQSDSVDLANSTSEILQLNSTDSSSNPVIVKFAKEGNALNMYRGGALIGNLLTSKVILNSLSFDRISTVKSEGEKIKMVLKNVQIKGARTENFYNTVILRGKY